MGGETQGLGGPDAPAEDGCRGAMDSRPNVRQTQSEEQAPK